MSKKEPSRPASAAAAPKVDGEAATGTAESGSDVATEISHKQCALQRHDLEVVGGYTQAFDAVPPRSPRDRKAVADRPHRKQSRNAWRAEP